MSWLAVDKNGTEYIYELCPIRCASAFIPLKSSLWISLPKGSIKKLIGKDLTWKDDPVEFTDE